MTETLTILATRYFIMAFFAIGGANAIVPEMHRLAVEQMHWMTDADFAVSLLEEVWLGWDDGEIEDDQGTKVPNTPENRTELLKWPHVKSAVLDAYTKSISGQAVQARKRGN